MKPCLPVRPQQHSFPGTSSALLIAVVLVLCGLNAAPLAAATGGADFCRNADLSALPEDLVLATAAACPAAARSQSVAPAARQAQAPMIAADRLTVGLVECADTVWLTQRAAEYGASITNGNPSACLYVIEVPAAQQTALWNTLHAQPGIMYVEADRRADALFTPNDPFYNNPARVYGPQQINAPAAWDVTQGRSDLIVAVLDSGVDFTHEELTGHLLPGYDYVNHDASPADDQGHGTHVTGIIAAGINNGIGIAGMASGVKILPMKVLSAQNAAWWGDVALAITDAVDQGARVINLSLGGAVDSMALRNAVAYAETHGVLVVVAAGNDAANTLYFPASYTNTNVLSVGATTVTGVRWTLSNYGPNVEIMAPGATIYSTYWKTGTVNSYQFMSGTSMAAPHAAGAAALLLSVNPSLTPSQIIAYLTSTATDMDAAGYDQYTGYGLINSGAAVQAVRQTMPASLSGFVWADSNGDAVRNTGEAGIANVTVALATANVTMATTTTDAAGAYRFDGLNSGAYTVSVVNATLPAGFDLITTASPAIVTVTVGGDYTADLGFAQWTGLEGLVWADANSNGTMDEQPTLGLTGARVTVKDAQGALVAEVITINGVYGVNGLRPGSYTVAVTGPTGYVATTPQTVTTAVLAGQAHDSISFGYALPTGVALQEFNARPTGSEIVLTWRLLQPDASAIFSIWRAESVAGPWAQVSLLPIAANGGADGEYHFTDGAVKRGHSYWYSLLSETDGQSFGPLSVQLADLNRIFMPQVKR